MCQGSTLMIKQLFPHMYIHVYRIPTMCVTEPVRTQPHCRELPLLMKMHFCSAMMAVCDGTVWISFRTRLSTTFAFPRHPLEHQSRVVYIQKYMCKSVAEEEKKENPDPIHHTGTIQTHKHKMNRTPGCPALRTGMVG